ncbi:MAG: hypothetical protein HY304_08780 [candidate division Zixibacteria bacterium]|nr:hypothetical protein [candidate division Zixibacteria bacterium]
MAALDALVFILILPANRSVTALALALFFDLALRLGRAVDFFAIIPPSGVETLAILPHRFANKPLSVNDLHSEAATSNLKLYPDTDRGKEIRKTKAGPLGPALIRNRD